MGLGTVTFRRENGWVSDVTEGGGLRGVCQGQWGGGGCRLSTLGAETLYEFPNRIRCEVLNITYAYQST